MYRNAVLVLAHGAPSILMHQLGYNNYALGWTTEEFWIDSWQERFLFPLNHPNCLWSPPTSCLVGTMSSYPGDKFASDEN